MKSQLVTIALVSFLAVSASAQTATAYFPNDGLTTGSANAFPWNTQQAPVAPATGYCVVNIYPAAQLLAQGVTPGMRVAGLAFSPQTAAGGTMVQPNCKVFIGHAAAVTGPTLWINNMADPTSTWDTTVDGPLTVPGWAQYVWAPIPMRGSACFIWDGIRDLVLMITHGGGWTGSYSPVSSPSPGYTRHGVTQFMPAPGTAQTTTGVLAPRLRVIFDTRPILTVNTSGGGIGDLSVSLSAVGPTIQEGYTLISTTTSGPLGAGGFLGLAPDFVTFTFLQTPPSIGNPLHWVAAPGVPGVYPNATFVLPAGTLSAFSGSAWDFVSVAFSPGLTTVELSCLQRVTF